MPSVYKLVDAPHLLPSGDFKGHLETVTFIAANKNESHRWWAVNVGTFEKDFTKIVSSELAHDRLRRGEVVGVPWAVTFPKATAPETPHTIFAHYSSSFISTCVRQPTDDLIQWWVSVFTKLDHRSHGVVGLVRNVGIGFREVVFDHFLGSLQQ